jgi:hypothetical protein
MNPEASALMQRGIALLNENTPGSLAEAVALFDRAITLRRESLVPGDHWMAYLTAASWMNRGDALTRLGETAALLQALHSYDEALAALRDAPPEANPLYRCRHAIAWMNRGITLHEQGTPASFASAAESFDRGIQLLAGHSEHSLLLACAWMNRGNALLRSEPARVAEARDSALAARGLVANSEREDITAAETGLKARHILCQTMAEFLSGDSASEDPMEMISTATDAVEEGLDLGRHWETRRETRFRSLLRGLFRFGVAVYRARQPQFLPEFVRENLSPPARAAFSDDAEMHTVAAEALQAVARDLHHDGFAAVNTPRFDRLLDTLRALRLVEDRLRELEAERRSGVDAAGAAPTTVVPLSSRPLP